MWTRLLSVSLVCVSLAACGGPPVTEGLWRASNPVIESDACALEIAWEIDSDWTADYTLAHGEDRDSFTLTAAGSDPVDCVADGQAFTCAGVAVIDYNEGIEELPAMDAVITLDSATEGELLDEVSSVATTTVEGTCEGGACDALLGSVADDIPNPCISVITLDYALVE
ncbi:MAG: hypothetical protein VX519_04065 [Myxococcota bacterium]|nr:hypothetical protein [Myxococcota bacterium]